MLVIMFALNSTAQAAINIQDNRATADYWAGRNKSGESRARTQSLTWRSIPKKFIRSG